MSDKVKFKKVKLPVHFNGISIGDETASVGIRLTHEDCCEPSQVTGDAKRDSEAAVLRAFQILCCRQLRGKIVLGKRDDGETQGKLMETDTVIEGVFDTANLSVGSKTIAVKLSMAKSETDLSTLSQFATRDGHLHITSVMEALELDDEEDDPDANDAERPMLDGEEGGGTATKARKSKAN